MLELAALAFTILVGAGTTYAARWLFSKEKQRRPARWDEVGGIALLAGIVAGVGAGGLISGLDEWDWGLAFLPGLFLGFWAAILPEAKGGVAVLGWGAFLLGGIFGLFIAAIGGLW